MIDLWDSLFRTLSALAVVLSVVFIRLRERRES